MEEIPTDMGTCCYLRLSFVRKRKVYESSPNDGAEGVNEVLFSEMDTLDS